MCVCVCESDCVCVCVCVFLCVRARESVCMFFMLIHSIHSSLTDHVYVCTYIHGKYIHTVHAYIRTYYIIGLHVCMYICMYVHTYGFQHTLCTYSTHTHNNTPFCAAPKISIPRRR